MSGTSADDEMVKYTGTFVSVLGSFYSSDGDAVLCRGKQARVVKRDQLAGRAGTAADDRGDMV